jgi:hypothetical protein
METANVYAAITKSDEQPDGTLLVTGIATDPTLDVDQQVCDPAWLKTAMPAWFSFGNVREQHSNIAAGVATEYKQDEGDRHVITAHIVDTGSIAKVKAKVLKGFSIGIRNPRIATDKAAPGGRIVDGQIVEVSLVDRPANPTCLLTLAKSAKPGTKVRTGDFDPQTRLVRVEEFEEKAEGADLVKTLTAEDLADVAVPDSPAEVAEAAPEVPAADAPVAVEAGTVSGAPVGGDVAAAGEGGGDAATPGAPGDIPVVEPAPDVPMVRPGESVLSPADELARRAALAAVVPPVDAVPVPEVAPVAVPVAEAPVEPAVKAVTPDAPALDLDVLAARVADLLKAAGTIPAAAPVAAPAVKGDVAAVVAHLSARGRAVPDLVKGDGVTHDVGALRSVRNGLLSLIIAEATEALNGDDETQDMRMLLDSLDVFLCWWRCEALNGEAPPPREVGAVDQTVEAAEAVASVLVGGPDDDLSGGVVSVKSSGCGCCDACTHDTTTAESAGKAVTSDAPVSIETPALVAGSTISKADQPETVQAPDAEASGPAVLQKAVEALTAENADLKARVEQLAKAAAPGGPVRTRPVAALRSSREGDVLRTKAAGFRRAARSGLTPDLAAEYERRADECEAQAAALTAEG